MSLLPLTAFAAETAQLKKNETGVYQDIFDQSIYYEGTRYLRLEKLYGAIFHKKTRSQNINVFDEVPDNSFFTNRHSREKLSAEDLEKGNQETGGPDLSGKLTIVDGRFEGVLPGFYVKDDKGETFYIEFDPADQMELVTSAEVITNRFYHALGYNVPEYNVIIFPPDKLVPAPDATLIDNTGFRHQLTREKLQEYLLFIPWDEQGSFRASARKILQGEDLGNARLTDREKDSQDKTLQENRREIRALKVFASWLNHDDVRAGNTRVMISQEDGKKILKTYLMSFSSSLGAQRDGAKTPMLGHEHMLDYGEIGKAFFSLGLWEKPWQKRWAQAGEQTNPSPAIGYFDNHYFEPGEFKTQLPYYAFKDVTRADGFWAAKIMMSFSDEDIAAMVNAGHFSKTEDSDYIMKTLIERRDMIGKYWFAKANPLDDFEIKDGELSFSDLAVDYGFAGKDASYNAEVVGRKGNTRAKITTLQSSEPSLKVDPSWFQQYEQVDLWIRTTRPGNKPTPYVLLKLKNDGISGVIHED